MPQDVAQLLEARRVLVKGLIDEPMATTVLAQMLFLFDQDANRSIDLIIDSEGGLAAPGLAIVDLMREHARLTNTIAPRHAAGIATIILACGTKGQRRIGQHAIIQLSPLSSMRETPETPAEIVRMQNAPIEILANCTPQRRDSIREDLLRGRTFDAQSALGYGLADTIAPDSASSTFGK